MQVWSDLMCIFFVSVTFMANLHFKYEVSSFNSSHHTQNSKSRSHDLFSTPFDPVLHFSLVLLVININQI